MAEHRLGLGEKTHRQCKPPSTPSRCPTGRSIAGRLPRPILSGLLLLSLLNHPTVVMAHKTFLFATVRDQSIEGEVYFAGGEAASHAAVTLFDSTGRQVDQTTTDQEGKFTFQPQFRCDYKLVADGGMGHRAEYVLSRQELPTDLPAIASDDKPDTDPASTSVAHDSTADHSHPHEDLADHDTAHSHDHPADAASVEALNRQIAALRKDLDKWKAQLQMQDILGGVGYILGFAGLFAYFLGARRKDQRTETIE